MTSTTGSIGGTDVPADIDTTTTEGKLKDLKRRVAEVAHAGSERAVEKQHARGKKTARERIELLLDEGSFVEMDKYARHRSVAFGQDKNRPYGDGVVTGYGTVDGRTVASSRRTSPSSAGPWARSSARRSSRSWTSP
jgi:propionyl-CoA carboxylase beta chain